MRKGEHFFETFAATPREDTERILQAIMVLRNLKRRSANVEKAYCWADLPEDEKLILKYPKGLDRYDDQGNELFICCEKNLYGAPNSGRNWSKHRDKTLLEEFNKDGSPWTCNVCEMDPCLFHFTYTHADTQIVDEYWAVIHTDDIDVVCTSDFIIDEIFKRLDEIWKLKIVDSGYILGVKRTLEYGEDGKIKSVEVTMTAFIEGMAGVFKEYIIDAQVGTPFPDKMMLSKDDVTDDDEGEAVKAAGYQRAMGMILWAARHAYPEVKQACSQLCSVMAKPSWKAFKAAMHSINYMVQRKDRGVKFSANGNKSPVGMSDASNKAPPEDRLCYHGWVIMWAGGPIASASKKLTNVGTSSEQNEYMGMFYAIKAIVWLRQLMEEMGWNEYITSPTVVFGDNICANRLCKEHFVSTRNQHIYTPYHWVHEAVVNGFAEIKWCKTEFNLADLFTKSVPRQVIIKLVNILTGYGDLTKLQQILEANLDQDAHKMIHSKN
jgi:hypothetical protein